MIAILAALIGLVIVVAAVGIPLWITQHRQPAQDPDETAAYLAATGRTAEQLRAGEPGHAVAAGELPPSLSTELDVPGEK